MSWAKCGRGWNRRIREGGCGESIGGARICDTGGASRVCLAHFPGSIGVEKLLAIRSTIRIRVRVRQSARPRLPVAPESSAKLVSRGNTGCMTGETRKRARIGDSGKELGFRYGGSRCKQYDRRYERDVSMGKMVKKRHRDPPLLTTDRDYSPLDLDGGGLLLSAVTIPFFYRLLQVPEGLTVRRQFLSSRSCGECSQWVGVRCGIPCIWCCRREVRDREDERTPGPDRGVQTDPHGHPLDRLSGGTYCSRL